MTPGWRCLNPTCGETRTGLSWAAADKAAEVHTKATKHPTTTWTTGSQRERDADGVARDRMGRAT